MSSDPKPGDSWLIYIYIYIYYGLSFRCPFVVLVTCYWVVLSLRSSLSIIKREKAHLSLFSLEEKESFKSGPYSPLEEERERERRGGERERERETLDTPTDTDFFSNIRNLVQGQFRQSIIQEIQRLMGL